MATPVSYGSLSFEQQIDYMQRKLPSIDYATVSREAHDTAFVVAGTNRTDLVTDIHQVLVRAMRDGSTLERFREDFYAVLDHYGWEPEGGRAWRSRVIYETNLRASYAAGRYAQLMELRTVRPYWMYNHSDAVITPREQHLAWNKLVLRWDDPWWETHYTPNGWGCQCYVTALNYRDLQRMGKIEPDTAPPDETVRVYYKGQWMDVPKGIDPGWNYAPGRSELAKSIQSSLEKTNKLPARPSAIMSQQLLAETTISETLQKDYRLFAETIVHNQVAAEQQMIIGALPFEVVEALQQKNIIPKTASITINASTITQLIKQPVITSSLLIELPTVLSNPQAVLLNSSSNNLLYIYNASPDVKWAVDVQLNLTTELTANQLQQVTLTELSQLASLGYEVIAGHL